MTMSAEKSSRRGGRRSGRRLRAVVRCVAVVAASSAAAISAQDATSSPFAWAIGRWEGVRVAAADGERAPLRVRIEPVLGGSAVVLDLEVRRDDGSIYRGVTLLYPGTGEGEWMMVYTSGGRPPAVYRGEASTTGAEFRSTDDSAERRSRLVVERIDEAHWRRTMLVSRDRGASWEELWRDELRAASTEG